VGCNRTRFELSLPLSSHFFHLRTTMMASSHPLIAKEPPSLCPSLNATPSYCLSPHSAALAHPSAHLLLLSAIAIRSTLMFFVCDRSTPPHNTEEQETHRLFALATSSMPSRHPSPDCAALARLSAQQNCSNHIRPTLGKSSSPSQRCT
jgi:hypothetical protein